MRTLLVATSLLFASLSLSPSAARADEASHKAAVLELFQVMHLEQVFQKGLQTALDAQVEANPALGQYRAIMMRFFQKYMGWSSIEDEVVALYVGAFSETEIRDLIAFYKSKTGRKAATKVPELMARGAEIGQKRLQAHMGELMQMLREAQTKSGP